MLCEENSCLSEYIISPIKFIKEIMLPIILNNKLSLSQMLIFFSSISEPKFRLLLEDPYGVGSSSIGDCLYLPDLFTGPSAFEANISLVLAKPMLFYLPFPLVFKSLPFTLLFIFFLLLLGSED